MRIPIAYFGWKAATLGLLPSLLTGRDIVSAGKESLGLLRKRFKDVAFLRLGYSILSWFIAIISYILTVYLVGQGSLFPVDLKGSGLYYFFLYATIPIVLSVAVVTIVLRPIYILASFNLYSEYAKVESIPTVKQPPGSMLVQVVLWMAILLLVLAGLFLFALQVLG